jgi:hypothetical protein
MKLAIGLVSLALAGVPIAVVPTAAAATAAQDISTCPEAVQIHRLTGAVLPAECAAFDTPGAPAPAAPAPPP